MDKVKEILEKQLELLFEEGTNCTIFEDKLKVNKELCRTAQMLILAGCQSRYGAAGGTRQLSSQP